MGLSFAIVMLASSIGSASASAVSRPPGGEINGGKPVTLRVDLWQFTPTLNTTKTVENPTVVRSSQIIANNFEKLYPNVKIVWIRGLDTMNQSALQSYYTTKIAAGDAPDIGFSWGASFTNNGWYEPLQNYLKQQDPFLKNKASWQSEFPSYLWKASTQQDSAGNTISIPFDLNPGPPTAIYYNKSILSKEHMAPPRNYDQFITDIRRLNAAGYIGIRPWTGMNEIYNWMYQFNLGPYYVQKDVLPVMRISPNVAMTQNQTLQAVKEGLFSPVLHAYARDFMQKFKEYFQLAPKGWQSTTAGTFQNEWDQGKIAMQEDGLWSLQGYASDTKRTFPFGLVPSPPITNDRYASPVQWTKSGPYQPASQMFFNIIKPSVEKNPGTLQAAVRFLEYFTAPQNLSLMINETGAGIGAAYGVPIPPVLKGWLLQSFPKTPLNGWAQPFDSQGGTDWVNYTQGWIDGKISNAAYYRDYDKLMAASADRTIAQLKINTKGWKIVLK